MVLVAFGLAGIIISAYVWHKQVTPGPVFCIGSGCAAVIRSPYGRLLGIPNGALGVFYFLGAVMVPLVEGRWPEFRSVMTLATGVALGLYLYLAYLQVFVLRALCSWCLTSAALTGGIFWVLLGPR